MTLEKMPLIPSECHPESSRVVWYQLAAFAQLPSPKPPPRPGRLATTPGWLPLLFPCPSLLTLEVVLPGKALLLGAGAYPP